MKNRQPIKKLITKFFIGFCVMSLFSANSFASPSRSLTVFAEQNMVLSLIKIARLYSQKNHVIVSVNFNSSAELMNEIDSGEPADIFISAHTGWIESLRQKGLTDIYNTGYIAGDKLVLVTSKNNKHIPGQLMEKNISLESALQIINREKLVLITEPEGSSSGKFSNDLVKFLNLSDLRLFTKLGEDHSNFLNLTGDNSESYALILASEIKNRTDLQVIVEQNYSHIHYQTLVIAGDNMETAREFLKFMKSETAKSVLRDNGFTID